MFIHSDVQLFYIPLQIEYIDDIFLLVVYIVLFRLVWLIVSVCHFHLCFLESSFVLFESRGT